MQCPILKALSNELRLLGFAESFEAFGENVAGYFDAAEQFAVDVLDIWVPAAVCFNV